MMSVVVENLFSDDRQKKLLIIRGLPGTGKSHLKINKIMRDGFFILDMDTLIQTDKNSVREAQMIIANKMLKCFQRQYKKVCITGIFSKKIEYEFYLNMARHFGYRPVVWEIRNYSEKPMECFNYSQHNFQEKYNNYLINSWEKDVDSVVYPSWMEDKGYYNYLKIVDVDEETEETEEKSDENESESEDVVEVYENESEDNPEEKNSSCFGKCESTGSELNFVVA